MTAERSGESASHLLQIPTAQKLQRPCEIILDQYLISEPIYKLVCLTQQLANNCRSGVFRKECHVQVSPTPTTEDWGEGIFSIDISWNIGTTDKPDLIRLLEIGLIALPDGRVLIPKTQRHKLGQLHRKDAELNPEYRDGEKLYRLIENNIQLQIEAFGLVLAVAILPQEVATICFPQVQPQVRIRQELQAIFQQRPDMNGVEFERLDNIRKRADARLLLAMLGLKREFPHPNLLEKGIFPVNKALILRAFERGFTDDEGTDRVRYRGIVNEILYG